MLLNLLNVYTIKNGLKNDKGIIVKIVVRLTSFGNIINNDILADRRSISRILQKNQIINANILIKVGLGIVVFQIIASYNLL